MKKIIILLIFILAAVGITYAVKPKQGIAPVVQPEEQVVQEIPRVEKDYVVYYGEDGRTAFEILQQLTGIEFQQFDFGVMVNSINGVRPDENHFWKLFYNGQESQVGAGDLQTRNGDVIEWKLEKIL